MDYKLSNISKEEYPEVMSVWEVSVKATHHFVKEEDILFFKEQLPKYLDPVRLFAFRDANGRILGFLGASNESIEMLFVHPAMRARKIGKTLINFALNELHLYKVDVNEQNEQAVGFYHKMGFSIIGRSELDATGKPYPILHMEYNA